MSALHFTRSGPDGYEVRRSGVLLGWVRFCRRPYDKPKRRGLGTHTHSNVRDWTWQRVGGDENKYPWPTRKAAASTLEAAFDDEYADAVVTTRLIAAAPDMARALLTILRCEDPCTACADATETALRKAGVL